MSKRPSEFKVLIIDDMASMRQMVLGCLQALGFKTATQAIDGEAAWTEILKAVQLNAPFDLVICDWNMPKMTGIALLKKVRAHPDLKAIPFLMVTAETARENIMEAINAGVSNYIVKPFTTVILREKLKKIIPGMIFE